ncbi:hypothetical protein D3C71_1690040 [compost metagenome]
MAFGPGHHFGAGQGVVLNVQQAGGGVADAGHALGLGHGGQLLGVFDAKAGGLDDKVMGGHKKSEKVVDLLQGTQHGANGV